MTHKDSRCERGARLDHKLDVIGHLVAGIQLTFIASLLFDGQQLKDLVLIQANTTGNLCQSLIGLVARFINNTDIKKLFLMLE